MDQLEEQDGATVINGLADLLAKNIHGGPDGLGQTIVSRVFRVALAQMVVGGEYAVTIIRLKLLTGLRAGDMLRLRESDLLAEGIQVKTSKTGKPLIYEWTDDLRAAVALVKDARPTQRTEFLFCNRRGEGHMNEQTGVAEGFGSMWQRFMGRVMNETAVKERFTEYDLRAKCASDAPSLERARELLAHADSRTTQRFYRRKPEIIRPAK